MSRMIAPRVSKCHGARCASLTIAYGRPGMSRLSVICHFRNEEVYLPYWLRHHRCLFDHGILIDYGSTDHSLEIIRALVPSWEVRPSRNHQFHSVAIDTEVMDIEIQISGWKMCLNVTEFVM